MMNKRPIIFIAAHPDDAEEGAGGTIAKYTHFENPDENYRVIIVYMTSGGAGIRGKTRAEAEKIRTSEAKNACKIMGAEPIFIGEEDGNCFPSKEVIMKLVELFKKENPLIIFTNWLFDTHGDHRATSFMVIEAYGKVYGHSYMSPIIHPFLISDQDPKIPAGLFFWETEPWAQSIRFIPDLLINIDETMEFKCEAIHAHASQNQGDSLLHWVEKVAKMRAEEAGGVFWNAEAFMRLRPGMY